MISVIISVRTILVFNVLTLLYHILYQKHKNPVTVKSNGKHKETTLVFYAESKKESVLKWKTKTKVAEPFVGKLTLSM